MKQRLLPLLLAVFLLAGCGNTPAEDPNQPKKYEASFFTLFDTFTIVQGYAHSEEEFQAQAQVIYDTLLEYHQLFDIYNDYEGINNLKTVNDQAGIAPVTVDRKIIDLLLDCRELYEATDHRVNAAMGSVLALWHEARSDGLNDPESAYLPDQAALEEAALHTSFDTVIIDEAASTVYLSDSEQRLDVGAIAKGWATERICQSLPSGLCISVGGNVRATGPKPIGDAPWIVGIQDPDGARGENLHTLTVSSGSVVSSGDYQRYYTVDGVNYHHIIDPDTLYPASYWRAVTVICEDSGLADALSTALSTLPQAEGQALLDKFGVVGMWVSLDGTLLYSPGFESYIRN